MKEVQVVTFDDSSSKAAFALMRLPISPLQYRTLRRKSEHPLKELEDFTRTLLDNDVLWVNLICGYLIASKSCKCIEAEGVNLLAALRLFLERNCGSVRLHSLISLREILLLVIDHKDLGFNSLNCIRLIDGDGRIEPTGSGNISGLKKDNA
jgi:hypothetical protein